MVQNQPPAPAWLAKSQEQSAHGNEGWNTGRPATVDKPAQIRAFNERNSNHLWQEFKKSFELERHGWWVGQRSLLGRKPCQRQQIGGNVHSKQHNSTLETSKYQAIRKHHYSKWHLVAAAAGEDSRQQQRKHQTKGDLLVQEVLTRVGGKIQDRLGVLRKNGNNKMTSGNLHPRTTKGASDRKIEQVITLSKTVKKVSSTMIVKCNQRWGQRS